MLIHPFICRYPSNLESFEFSQPSNDIAAKQARFTRRYPAMSTRRSTRAGSRAASSVNGVYAVGPEDIPSRTPGRGRPKKSGGSTAGSERGSASLPSMAATNSTSYGTNTLALPNYSPRGAPLANDISTVIEGLLEPEPVRKGSRLRPDSPQEPVPDGKLFRCSVFSFFLKKRKETWANPS